MKDFILNKLEHGKIARIYEKTYQSILTRLTADGFFPESYSGKYEGEFTRSAGALAIMFTEMREYEKAERCLRYLFDLYERLNLPRFPHCFAYNAEGLLLMEDQVDGAAHCIYAYANLCLTSPCQAFENEFYELAVKEIKTYYSNRYFYGEGSKYTVSLIRNYYFEHSRECHYWDVFDILTQTFVLAACEKMLLLSKKRGDGETTQYLTKKRDEHYGGIERNMRFRDCYAEMVCPKENGTEVYSALGWPLLAPLAIDWEGLDTNKYKHTIETMLSKTKLTDKTSGREVYCSAYFPDDSKELLIFGKIIGWQIDYFRKTRQYEKILNWIDFIEVNNSGDDILAEMYTYKDGVWLPEDYGNGEQCIWFCLSVYRLKQSLRE